MVAGSDLLVVVVVAIIIDVGTTVTSVMPIVAADFFAMTPTLAIFRLFISLFSIR